MYRVLVLAGPPELSLFAVLDGREFLTVQAAMAYALCGAVPMPYFRQGRPLSVIDSNGNPIACPHTLAN